MIARAAGRAVLLGLVWWAGLAAGAELTAEPSATGVTVKIAGRLFTEYVFSSGGKPILWPIIGPTGEPMTRAYPMAGAVQTKDHVHHRSLWFSFGSVNGIDFWTEGTGRGTVAHRKLIQVAGGKLALIVTANDWRGPDGKKQCEDQRTLRFGADGQSRWIDFQIAIRASDGPVTFADTKEGAFGLRVADSMRVEARPAASQNENVPAGRIVNSRGQTDAAAWGQAAAWVDYSGPVAGQVLGIAILNHPSSFRFPTRWHVRTYGLFAANPFGQRGLTGDRHADGSYTLPAGQTLTLRYRVVLHRGDEKAAQIEQVFREYGQE